MIDAAERKAAEMGHPFVIAVADDSGILEASAGWTGGQEDHRDLRAAGPQLTDDLEAIPVRHHHGRDGLEQTGEVGDGRRARSAARLGQSRY